MEKEPSKIRTIRKDAELEAWRKARKPSAVQWILTLFVAISISAFVLGVLPIIPPPLKGIRAFLLVAGGIGSFFSMILLGLYKGKVVFLKEAALGILIFINGPILIVLDYLASLTPYDIHSFFGMIILLGIIPMPLGIYMMAAALSRTEEIVTRGTEERIKFPKGATVGIVVYLIGLSMIVGVLINPGLYESTVNGLVLLGLILMFAGLSFIYIFQYTKSILEIDNEEVYDAEEERYIKFHEQLRRERLK